MLLYTFTPFHTLQKALHAFIRFYILSNIVIYTFLRFYMLLCAFHALSYAFDMLSQAFKCKKAKRPLHPLNYTIVRLSRCAAGKKTLDAFIHFHTLSYALEGFTCAKKQNVASSSSATYTNVRLSRCAAGKNSRCNYISSS